MEKNTVLWNRYQKHLCLCPEIGLTLDISRMKFSDTFFGQMEAVIQSAFSEMSDLEKAGTSIISPVNMKLPVKSGMCSTAWFSRWSLLCSC